MQEGTLYTDCEQCSSLGCWTRSPERTRNSITNYGEEQCTRCDGVGMDILKSGWPSGRDHNEAHAHRALAMRRLWD